MEVTVNALPSAGIECCNTCDSAITTLVPGPTGAAGADGADGLDGENAFTTLAASFVQPAASANVTIQVFTSEWMAVGQYIFIANGGHYKVMAVPTSTTATVQNLDYTGSAAVGASVANASAVTPAGMKGADGALSGAAGGDLTGTYPNPTIANGAVTAAKVAAANVDGVSGTASMRTLGTGAQQACAGNDSRLSNARTPTGAAGGDLTGTYPDPELGASGVTGGDYGGDQQVTFSVDSKGIMTSASQRAPRYGLLGKLMGADFNVTTDQPITINASRYIIRRIVVENASISLTTAAGGIYTNAAKAGTIIVAASQVYSALTASSKWKDLTLEAVVGTDIFTASTIYLSLTTAQGAASTANVWVFGENITNP